MASLPKSSSRRVMVVSLTSPSAIRILFRAIEHTSKAHRELRDDMFQRIAEDPRLQREILKVLAKHPATQRKILKELVRNLQFRKTLLKTTQG